MKKLFLLLFGLAAVSSALAVTPADPTNVRWYDCGDESGDSYLTFTLPTVDVDGNPLDMEMMGYRIYIDDDQIVSFSSTQYPNVWGTTTELYYYNWEAGSDIQSGGVFFYRTNADGYERFFNNRIGIQVFYLNDSFGIGGVSNIVYTELAPVVALPKPANPKIEEWIDYGAYIEAPDFYFIQGSYMSYSFARVWDGSAWQLIDVDGNYLDTDKVSFSIYTDNDQVFTFTPEMFDQVEEPTTQFPYNARSYSGDVGMTDIHFNDLTNDVDGLAEIGVEMERFFDWRIGIRTNYTDGGQTNSSDIFYMEIYPQLQEAKNVTTTSFLADWSCDAENTFIINNFVGDGCGYFLHVVDKATQEDVLTQNVVPTNTYLDELNHTQYLPGATYAVEGLTPGTTYEFYVEVKQNTGMSYQSVVREVTLPQEGHGYDLGDVNHDHAVNIADVTALIDYLLNPASEVCTICADVNTDNSVNIADVTALIDMLLSNGTN